MVDVGDYVALECALQLKDRYAARVTVLSLGTPEAVRTLQRCLACGADHAVLLSDEALRGSDAYAVSYALAGAIQRLEAEEPVTLVLCGSGDGGSGMIGPSLARHLGWPQITCAREIVDIQLDAGTIIAERLLERGCERVRTKFPALVTVSAEAPAIRYAGLPEVLRALRDAPEMWTLADLERDPAFIGADGSFTRVQRLIPRPPRTGALRVEVETVGVEAAVATILRALKGQS